MVEVGQVDPLDVRGRNQTEQFTVGGVSTVHQDAQHRAPGATQQLDAAENPLQVAVLQAPGGLDDRVRLCLRAR